jgi:hypothetical protein
VGRSKAISVGRRDAHLQRWRSESRGREAVGGSEPSGPCPPCSEGLDTPRTRVGSSGSHVDHEPTRESSCPPPTVPGVASAVSVDMLVSLRRPTDTSVGRDPRVTVVAQTVTGELR